MEAMTQRRTILLVVRIRDSMLAGEVPQKSRKSWKVRNTFRGFMAVPVRGNLLWRLLLSGFLSAQLLWPDAL